jgi:hypothetical protein
MSGGVLLSHRVAPAVPSALRVLASGFGMCPGVSLALWPPKLWYQHHPNVSGVWWSRLHVAPVSGPGGVGCRGVRVCVVLYVCFRLLGTTEWTRAISGHARQPYNSVCVVIVKLSAY